MTSVRIGVMGGTFDPIHNGHLVAAAEVADRLDLDRVILCPAGQPWHRAAPPVAGVHDRFAMTELAARADPRFTASRVDIDRVGPTFTIDTLRDLRAGFAAHDPETSAEWYFITGADALDQFMTWKHPLEIVELAHLVGVTRPGHGLRNPDLPDGRWTLVEIPALDISSTRIRELLGNGDPVDALVPAAVAQYMERHDLYRGGPS